MNNQADPKLKLRDIRTTLPKKIHNGVLSQKPSRLSTSKVDKQIRSEIENRPGL